MKDDQVVLLESLQEKMNQITRQIKEVVIPLKEVITLKECGLYTGLSASYLRKLTHYQHIPFYKPHGKKIYFKRREIDNWLLTNKSQSRQEIETTASNYITGL